MNEGITKSSTGKGKVTIIGAGYVGASIAYALTLNNLAEKIVLVDINEDKANGEALDINNGIPFVKRTKVYTGKYEDITDSNLIIITAGRNRKNGESRLDMIEDNYKVLKNVTKKINEFYIDGVILIVSNPVDILVTLCDRWLEIPKGKIFGTGCILDSSRLESVLAHYIDVDYNEINGMVIGEHGESLVIPWSNIFIGNTCISEYCKKSKIEWSEGVRFEIENQVKRMGAEIIKYKSRTHFGISTCVCLLADSVLNNKSIIMSVSSPIEGLFGIDDTSLSLPSVICGYGVKRQIEINLNEKELNKLRRSSIQLKKIINKLGKK